MESVGFNYFLLLPFFFFLFLFCCVSVSSHVCFVLVKEEAVSLKYVFKK